MPLVRVAKVMLMDTNHLLQIEHLQIKLPAMDRAILQNIHYTINPGDFVVVLGGNGSGKSSLIKAINRTYPISSGKILFQQKPIANYSQADFAKQVITLTQDTSHSLFNDLTVLENCLLWELRHESVSLRYATLTQRQFFHDYLAAFNAQLPEKLDTTCSRLSGGEKQALILALCLRHPPTLLLLDEHTSALDPKTGHYIMGRTHAELIQHHITCVMTTHDLDDAMAYGNRLLALKEGKIVYQADGEQKQQLKRSDLLTFCY